jgi:hypothetical protein
MQLDLENPYASPRGFEVALVAPSPRSISLIRGLAYGVIWEAAGASAILAIAFVARLILVERGAFSNRMESILHTFPENLAGAFFFAALFALSAIATYTPAIRVSFGRTLLMVISIYFVWTFSLALISATVEWPFTVRRRYGGPSVTEWIWIVTWVAIGPTSFTAYLLHLRTRKTQASELPSLGQPA